MQANRSNSRAQASNAEREANAQAAQRRAEMQQAAQVARVALARSLERQADREAAQSAGSKGDFGTSTRTVKALRTTSKQPDFLTTGDSSGFVDELPAEDSINADPTESRPSLEDREDQANAPSNDSGGATESNNEGQGSGFIDPGNAPAPETSTNKINGTNGHDNLILDQKASSDGRVVRLKDGNDTFGVKKGDGATIIRGGLGADIVMFQGSVSEYTVERNEGQASWSVTEKNTGATHTLSGVEQIGFMDVTVDPHTQDSKLLSHQILSHNGAEALVVGSNSNDVIINSAPGSTVYGGGGSDIYIASTNNISGSLSLNLDLASLPPSKVLFDNTGISTAYISLDASAQIIAGNGSERLVFEGSRDDYEITISDNGSYWIKNIYTNVVHVSESGSSISFQDSESYRAEVQNVVAAASGSGAATLQTFAQPELDTSSTARSMREIPPPGPAAQPMDAPEEVGEETINMGEAIAEQEQAWQNLLAEIHALTEQIRQEVTATTGELELPPPVPLPQDTVNLAPPAPSNAGYNPYWTDSEADTDSLVAEEGSTDAVAIEGEIIEGEVIAEAAEISAGVLVGGAVLAVGVAAAVVFGAYYLNKWVHRDQP